MVMKRNAMSKILRRSIFRSFGRYVAIAAIIALGAGFFVGLVMTKTDMVATGQRYTDQQNLFDIRVLGSYGWDQTSVDAFEALDAVADAEGAISMDLLAKTGSSGDEEVYKFLSIPEKVNRVALRIGQMPQSPDECLADGFHGSIKLLGKTVVLSDSNSQDDLDCMNQRTFRIVGLVASPLYMDLNRGTTSVGSGSLSGFYYVPRDAFGMDYFTEISLTIPGDYAIYTDEYDDALDAATEALEMSAEKLNQERFIRVKEDAQQAYEQGYQEFLEGMEEYLEEKKKAQQELRDAKEELEKGQQELEENRVKLEDAEKQINDGWEQLERGKKQLSASRAAYEEKWLAADFELRKAKAELDRQQSSLESYYKAAMAVVPITQQVVENLQSRINAMDPNDLGQQILRRILEAQLSSAQSTLDRFREVTDGMAAIQEGYQQIAAQRQQLNNGEKQLENAEASIEANEKKLKQSEKELKELWEEWHKGEQELAEGWREYTEGKADAERELAEGSQKLEDAKEALLKARRKISDMGEPELFLLDRNSNVGYVNLDGNSDIVAGVSRVFPVFFLLVAALVCITTMTRMIDEERTQIGTLKALGYSNAAIIGKYILYSGSGGLLGCSLGLWAGCTLFPQVIWQAYCIMIYIQPSVVLMVNWRLCITVVLAYTGLMAGVTWYCCHNTLREEPAELIRPKAPEAGKKVLLEYFPFWKYISFLNKVTIRNIFRYRQRLAMMLVGIGGCTALLLTGFGLRDSIVNIMSYQFRDITQYDLSVYFQKENSPEQLLEFQQIVEADGQEWLLYHQSSVDLSFGSKVKGIYMISAGEELTEFISLHSGSEAISMPKAGEAVLSVGVAENMGIHQGDHILLRDSDLRTLNLTVSGIYDNHIYNYVIVSPQTLEEQWGEAPEIQMAFIKTSEGQNVYALSAKLSGLSNVMNTSVSQDVANMVSGMMDALDLVVWVIIFCAGLLAITVLYNLTNININERIREIATIKVLGFNQSETAAYVFKENFVLTVVGAALGLGLGKLLLNFVIAQIKIDLIWLRPVAERESYVWAIALTLLSAMIVSFIFFFKLEKINMAEALKSVE